MVQAMRAASLFLVCLVLAAGAAPAWAGETQCWRENGALVVPAALGDVTGDFILDLSAPRSQVHNTRAQGDGEDGPTLTGAFALAGVRMRRVTFEVADLDARSWGFPTNINGVIGADVLAGYVIDIRYAPCRITLRGRAPRLAGGMELPLKLLAGVPTVRAGVSDGQTSLTGAFGIDTSSAGVRIAERTAHLSHTLEGLDAASRADPPGRLRALSLNGVLIADTPAALDPEAPTEILGVIGNDVWSRYDVRVDLRRGRLVLLPALHGAGPARSARAGKSGDAR